MEMVELRKDRYQMMARGIILLGRIKDHLVGIDEDDLTQAEGQIKPEVEEFLIARSELMDQD